MTELTIQKNDAGQRADRFLAKAFPRLKSSLVCKLMRKKRIKLNGARVEPNAILKEGDVLRFYLSEELLSKEPIRETADFRGISAEISVVYEDENVLLVDKPVGLVVHEDSDNTADTLINRILSYLYQKGEYDPERENSFAPALVNRIDRNTSGIVIAAKNAESLRVLNQKVRDREIKKLYLCAVFGTPEPRSATLTAYLKKLPEENRVLVSDKPRPEHLTIKTKYRVLESGGELSLLEVDLLTGRTHQIRAHFAHIGHPLLGDGKYGENALNKRYGAKFQALCAYKLKFAFTTDAGCLEYLNGREFSVGGADGLWFVKLFK
ncbi:MAG: RluA family pseudouridine synthase [Lachnospiraceae bacterium]|nr:RluA family pseudouridine synthase [Ruminococcus sp.]MCM1275114.1 RluA family pseudouridine synthase [Lachnospiraceae bacterium]